MTIEKVFSQKIITLNGSERKLEICLGDIVGSRGDSPTDMLVISAFPDDYIQSPGTIIHRLGQAGICVADLAKNKLHDYRSGWHSWISNQLPDGLPARQLLCFEHGYDKTPEAVIGNIFRSLREHMLSEAALIGVDTQISTLRIPLLATGDQKASRLSVLKKIIEQSFMHLLWGIDVKNIQIFIRESVPDVYSLLVNSGAEIERNIYNCSSLRVADNFLHDIFFSYRHRHIAKAYSFLDAIKVENPSIKIFIDDQKLKPGRFWKPDLLKGISESRQALCLITDDYPDSVECMDEFHAAFLLNRQRKNYLIPVFCLEEKTINDLPDSIKNVHGLHHKYINFDATEIAKSVAKYLPA